MSSILPFDLVRIDDPNGTSSYLTPDQFLAIPLSTRLQYILEHRIEFLKGNVPVPSREALGELRRQRAAAAA